MSCPGFALLLAVVDTSVFIASPAVVQSLVESMEALDDPVRASSDGPFQLRIQVVVPFKVLHLLRVSTCSSSCSDAHG